MKKNLLKSMLVALMVMVGGSAWAGDKTVVKYSFDDASSPEVTAGTRVSLDYTKTSVITSSAFLNAWNNENGDPGASTVSLSNIDLSGETWTLSFEWAACGGCNKKPDHTTLKAGDTNLFDLTGNANWNTTVTITYAGSDGTKTLPVPGCDKGKRFTAGTGDQLNTAAYWHHIVVTGSASGVTMTITNSSTGTAVVENVMLSETNVNPTSLIIEPCCGGAIGIDELSLTYYVEGEVIQTPTANYTAVNGIERTITATCETEDATLYYSTDGENWTEGASVTVSASGNVYFKAVKGSSESDVLTFAAEAGTEIVLNTPAIVRNANGIVTISADQSKLLLSPEATIYYTYGEENGSFTGSKELTVAADATITAYAEAEGYATSLTATRAVALFPEQVDTLFSAAAATKGWSANAFSNETITASERTYATLLLDEAAWSENVLFQTDGAWGLRASGNWYINSNTDNSWLLVKDGKAGNIVIVDATFAPAETVNATYAEKYSFGSKHAYTIDADGNAEFALIKPSASVMDYLYGLYGYSLIKEEEIITPAYGTIWENGETTTDENENTNAEIAAAYFNNFAKANDTIRATVVVAAPARAAGPARIIATGDLSVFAGMNPIYEAANIPVGESKLDIALDNEDLAAIAEAGSLKFVYSNLTLKKVELIEGAVDPATLAAAKEALQTAIAIASNINPEGLAEAIAAAQAVLTNEDATLLQIIQATQALEAAIKKYFEAVLPRLGAIVGGLNDSTLNAAYADAQAALAKEDVTPQELAAAMQKIIVVAQAVAPTHLQNLKVYAVKYGAEEAVALVDSALVAINEGNVAKIIATMAAVKEAATPLAKQVLGGIIEYVKAFGLTEQAAQAQAALESDNYVTMITVAKALFNHLIAAAKDYLPKLAIIAEGLNDSTLNAAYAEADTLLAKESITPEELGAAMQKIIVAAKAVAPAHLQNLRAYALKYGQEGTAALVDSALVAIEEGNVSKIIATMTAVREAATPLATNILTQLVGYAQNYAGFEEDVTEAQAVLRGGNYITMITTAKALYAKLIAAAKAYVAKVKAIPTEGKEGVDDLNTAINAAELALAAEDSDFSAINTAITNLIAAVEAFTKANYFIDFAAGQYYIIDAESGKFMAAGHDYGTRGIVNEIGLDLTLTPNTESRMITIDTRVKNDNNHFLGTNLYMDAATTEWALEYKGFGFWITDGTKYISIDDKDNLVMSETPREWIIVTSEGVKATRMEELAEATKDAPKDATWAIQAPNFNRNDQRVDAWQISSDCTNKNLNGGNQTNNCAESWHSTFTISQTLTGMPKGVYALTAQGFYRQDDNATEDAPVFFANAETGAVPAKTGTENSMSDASVSFTNGSYVIDPIFVEVGEDSTLAIGIKGTATHQWVIWDNFQLKYYGSAASIDEIKNAAIYAEMLALREQLKNIKNEVEIQVIKDSIDSVLSSNENPEGAEAINATIASLKAALEVAQAYVKAKNVLPNMEQLTEETNFYTADALQSYYTQWNEKYQAGTLTKDEANALQDPFLISGWRASVTVDDLLMSVWGVATEQWDNLHVNTWSTEGETDGSEFKVPFIEYWTGDANSLGEKALTATMTGLEEGHYQVGIRVRVRVKNAAQAPATGITMNVNGETAVDVCAGTQVGETQFYLGEFTAEGDVYEEGVLKLNINVAAENNISWLAFKDAMYTRVGKTVGIAGVKSVNKLDGTIYNLNGQKMEKAQKGLYIINGKKVVVK